MRVDAFKRFVVTRAGRVRCEAQWRLGPDWCGRLTDCDLWYVWDGRGRMRLRQGSIDLHPGICLWMRPGGRYEAVHDPATPLGVAFVHFTPYKARGRRCLKDSALPKEVHYVRDEWLINTLMSKIARLMQGRDVRTRESATARQRQAADLLRCVVQELLRPNQRLTPASHERYREVIERQVAMIFEHPGVAYPVHELARQAHIAAGYYSRLFGKIMGMPPRELIQRARLERASQLLRESSASISEIAVQTGYADVYQFSRLFKKRMGVAPGRWRKLP